MQQITSDQIRPPRIGLHPIPKLPVFLRLVLIILSGFTIANLAVRTMGQYTTLRPPNPFSEFADVFPGQPATAAEARAFSCQDKYNYSATGHDLTILYCEVTPAESIFSSVQIIISQNVIRQCIFVTRDNTLKVGDLAIFLETPAIYSNYQVTYFSLPSGFIIAGTARHFSLFLSVLSVSFTAKNART
jgi:hypothetical protein